MTSLKERRAVHAVLGHSLPSATWALNPSSAGAAHMTGVVGLFARQAGRLAAGRPSTAAAAPYAPGRGARPGNVGQHDLGIGGRHGWPAGLSYWRTGPVPGAAWSTSSPLAIGQNEQVASFGVGRGRSPLRLAARGPPGPSGWPWPRLVGHRMATVAAAASRGQKRSPLDAKGSTDALVANGTKFSAWSLKAGSRRWAEDQVMKVAIQYGSSS